MRGECDALSAAAIHTTHTSFEKLSKNTSFEKRATFSLKSQYQNTQTQSTKEKRPIC
jgi:hypothetical protein